MDRKLQVFISSTFIDLEKERQAAVEAVLRSRHIPAGMELFAASDESQMAVIRDWIDDSDAYLLVLGGRYGSIEPKSGKSYTELEYEYAVEKGKRLFAVVMAEDMLQAKVKKQGKTKDVIEIDNPDKYRAFKAVVTEKMCRFFSTLDALKLAVMESLSVIQHDDTLSGWVRRSSINDPKEQLDTITKLLAERDVLAAEVERLRESVKQTTVETPEARLAKLNDMERWFLLMAAENNGYLRISGAHTTSCNIVGDNISLVLKNIQGREGVVRAVDTLEALTNQGYFSRPGEFAFANATFVTYQLRGIGFDVVKKMEHSKKDRLRNLSELPGL